MKKSKGFIITAIIVLLVIMGLIGFLLYKSSSKKVDNITIENKNIEEIDNSTIDNNISEEVNENLNYFKQVQLNEDFIDIKEVAVAKIELNNENLNNSTKKTYTMNADVDKDGIEDTIKLEEIMDERGKSTGVYNIYFNDEIFVDESSRCMDRYISFYVADLNKNDEYLDFLIYGDYASYDYGYEIYSFNGTNFEKKCDNSISISGKNLYISEQDKVIVSTGDLADSNPIIATEYYSYTSNEMISIPVSSLENVKVTVKNICFTKDLSSIQEVLDDISEDLDFDERIKKHGITMYDSLEVYIINYDNGSDKMKVKLEDGTEGYIFTINGNFAG